MFYNLNIKNRNPGYCDFRDEKEDPLCSFVDGMGTFFTLSSDDDYMNIIPRVDEIKRTSMNFEVFDGSYSITPERDSVEFNTTVSINKNPPVSNYTTRVKSYKKIPFQTIANSLIENDTTTFVKNLFQLGLIKTKNKILFIPKESMKKIDTTSLSKKRMLFHTIFDRITFKNSTTTEPPTPVLSVGSDDWLSPTSTRFGCLEEKYSSRSDIGDGSITCEITLNDMKKRCSYPNGCNARVSYWTCKNKRPYMEDRIVIDNISKTPTSTTTSRSFFFPRSIKKRNPVNSSVSSLYAVFDGHSGSLASQSLMNTIISLDEDFVATGNTEGTTCCACVLTGDKRIICANTGDSRAIVARSDGSFIPLSRDHKPYLQDELKRIVDLGGYVQYRKGQWRMQGRLALSRAIGDATMKPFATCEPDVYDYRLSESDSFLVIASDGLWDVLENEQVAKMVTSSYSLNNFEIVARKLCATARNLGSGDNLSVIIVDLRKIVSS